MSVAGLAVLVLNVTAAQGQTGDVSFVDITDAVTGRFFDAANTRQDPANPDRLIIAFNTGRDPATWRANDFRASTAAFSHTSAMDTISFRIVASEGYYVKTVTYIQNGSGAVVRTGIARGASNWVVGDYAVDLGTYGTNPDLKGTIDLTELYWQVVPVSITTGLHAFSLPTAGSATLSITEAIVVVEVEALPIPVVDEPPAVEEPAPPAEESAPPPPIVE